MSAMKTLIFLFAFVPSASALTSEQAAWYSRLPLKCVETEFPNKQDHVADGLDDMARPRDAHPAFFGCFDWHSSVHGHWLMVRVLKSDTGVPSGTHRPAITERPDSARMRAVLDAHFSTAAVRGELTYLAGANRKTFERTYGWAWLLKLAEELRGWDDPDGRRWSKNLQPLADAFATRYALFLPKLTYPIRTGVHPNTAFALAFALDYARASRDEKLANLLIERAKTYYLKDKDYPASWEPGGEDFFSPALLEADLMRRVLGPKEFAAWLDAFLPELGRGGPQSLIVPAIVTDRTDPKIVHLDGLNLSRAWCLRGIAAALPAGDARKTELEVIASIHLDASLPHVKSGDYAGEHWLASFAAYAESP